MAGILKFSSKKTTTHHLARPGELDWELWSFSSPTNGRLERTLPGADLSSLPAETRLALPIRQTLGVALWLQTEDHSLFAEMIPVQLEKRGLLKNPDRPPPFFRQLVTQKEGRSLVFVLLVNPEIPALYCQALTGDYDFSARCRALPMDGYTFWREEGTLVVCLTRQGKIAHLQALSGPELSESLGRELLCLHVRLGWESIATELSWQIFFQGNFSPEEYARARNILQTEPTLLGNTQPLFQETSLGLTPAVVTASRTEVEKKKRWAKIWRQIGLAYLVIIALLIAHYGWLSYQTYQIRTKLQASQSTVDHLTNLADIWHALQPAINPEYYPFETLQVGVTNLPPEARLTLFEHNSFRATIRGETSDGASAFRFLNSINANQNSKKWHWNMAQPEFLPNNHAQFQLTGDHGAAPQK